LERFKLANAQYLGVKRNRILSQTKYTLSIIFQSSGVAGGQVGTRAPERRNGGVSVHILKSYKNAF